MLFVSLLYSVLREKEEGKAKHRMFTHSAMAGLSVSRKDMGGGSGVEWGMTGARGPQAQRARTFNSCLVKSLSQQQG